MSEISKPSKHISIPPKGAIALVIILAIVGLGIMCTFRFNSPIPTVSITTTTQNIALPGELSVAFPDQGQSAVGTDTFGVMAASPDQAPIPIASVAKIMTAYIVLKDHPLQPGEEGPSLTMTAEDVAGYKYALQNKSFLFAGCFRREAH